MRACRICKKSPARQHSPHCGPCHSEILNASQQRRLWSVNATAQVTMAIKRGDLPNLREFEFPCDDCGGRALCYEHRDYTKPLLVDPVCHSCNHKRGPAAWPRVDFDRSHFNFDDNNIGDLRARMQLPEIERAKVRKNNSG